MFRNEAAVWGWYWHPKAFPSPSRGMPETSFLSISAVELPNLLLQLWTPRSSWWWGWASIPSRHTHVYSTHTHIYMVDHIERDTQDPCKHKQHQRPGLIALQLISLLVGNLETERERWTDMYNMEPLAAGLRHAVHPVLDPHFALLPHMYAHTRRSPDQPLGPTPSSAFGQDPLVPRWPASSMVSPPVT